MRNRRHKASMMSKLLSSSGGGGGGPSGGLNDAVAATFPTVVNSVDAGGDWGDKVGYLQSTISTDNGYHASEYKGPRTMDNGDSLEWRAVTDIGGLTNYNAARICLYETNNWRMDFGIVYDNGLKLSVTRYDNVGTFKSHVYLNGTYAANEYYKVYYPDAGGNMFFQTSSDGVSWVDVANYPWVLKDICIRNAYQTTVNTGKLIDFKLYDLKTVVGGAP